jgi:uncharacterized protein
VEFTPETRFDHASFLELKEGLERLLGRSVDLVDRPAIERSKNWIRRRSILDDARPVFSA